MTRFGRLGSTSSVRRLGYSVAALATLTLLTACDSGSPTPSPTGAITPAPVVTVTVAPSPTPTPIETPTPAALGWPRDGWTPHTGLAEGLNGVAVYFPDSWTFDTNESGLWWDGTYHVFCDVHLDHTLLQAGAPSVQTLATTQWDLIGYSEVTNQSGFTTFYGYPGWRGDVPLELLPGTVEHRAYVVVGDVWISCGAITRNTTASGDELWDIVDSIQTPPPELPLTPQAWNAN